MGVINHFPVLTRFKFEPFFKILGYCHEIIIKLNQNIPLPYLSCGDFDNRVTDYGSES
jgi:hypothetical protein